MELTDIKSLSVAQVSKKLEDIRASPPAQKLRDVIEWILKVPKTYPKLFNDVASTLAKITEQTVDVNLLEKIIVFFKNNQERCDTACAEHFFFVSFIVHARENEALDDAADEILRRFQSKPGDYTEVMAPLLKSRVVPKLKELAEAKNYTSSLAVWRAIVRTTKLKITTAVTNDVLQIATMAFKENNPEYHALAFKSWRVLIENLAPEVLRKPAYIRLVLNPLNRTYRDTDANSTLQKYIAWWQHVVTLGEDAELNFDGVVAPLLQKAFCMPTAKARQVNPTFFANPTRVIPQCAYIILALTWYSGCLGLRQVLEKLAQPNFAINHQTFKVQCLAKHSHVFDEALSLVVNNVAQKVAPPSKDYPLLLCRILLSRIRDFYYNDNHDMVRLILSTVYGILQTRLDLEHALCIFQDLAERIPPKVMSSSQFNFRKGTFSMHECPILTLTSFYIRHVAEACHAAGGEPNRRRFRQCLKTLLEHGGKAMNPLRLADHVLVSLQDTETLEAESWQEVASFLKSQIEVPAGEQGHIEPDPSTIAGVLAFPVRNSFPLTGSVTKGWIELLTSIMKADTEDVNHTKTIPEICNRACDLISTSTHELNRLLLISQMMESLVKYCDLQSSTTTLDSSPTRRTRKQGNVEPFVKLLVEIIRKGCDQLKTEKTPKAACQFYVNVVEMVHTLLRDSGTTELCKDLVLKLVPELIPILEVTTSKNAMKNSPLLHVESALLTAVDHVLYALKKKSEDLPKRDEPLLALIRLVVKTLKGHWKASVNETVQELAKIFQLTPEKKTPLKRSAPAPVDSPIKTSLPSARASEPAEPNPADDSPPERKRTRSQPDALALRNGSVRDKGTMKPPQVAKRKSKTAPEEEFVPIINTKKKSGIYTEHQMEKLKEQKIIPSMYEDLSRSSQGTLTGPPTTLVETKLQLPVIEENTPPSTTNGSHKTNGKRSTRETARKSIASARKSSLRGLEGRLSSDEDLECAFSANSQDTSPEAGVHPTKSPVKRQDRENTPPKSKDSISRPQSPQAEEPKTENPASSQEDETAVDGETKDPAEPATQTPEKPKGALKRKLGRPSHSPLAAKLRPKRSCSNADKTKGKQSLQKADGDQSLRLNDSDSLMDTEAKPDVAKDARKSKLSTKSATPESTPKSADKCEASAPKIEVRSEASDTKTATPQKVTVDARASPPNGTPGASKQSLVNKLKEAVGTQREGVLKFISSPEFLQTMTTEERRMFLASFFKNVSDYLL